MKLSRPREAHSPSLFLQHACKHAGCVYTVAGRSPMSRAVPLVLQLLIFILDLSSCGSIEVVPTNQSQHVVECTYVSRIVEDHFAQQQHFMYDLCSVDGNTSYAFAPDVLHLVNLPGDSHSPGERLLLHVRSATTKDLNAHHSRRLQHNEQPEVHAPMWHASARGLFVERVITMSPPSWNRTDGVGDHRRKLTARGRTLLSICMQYHHSTHTCTNADEPWTRGVPQTHTTAAYNRLEPAWDSTNSRFYIIQMDTIERGEQMNFDKISCETFMQNEPAKALEYARRALCEYDTDACDLVDGPADELKKGLALNYDEDDVDIFYAYGAAWAGWIQANTSDWNAIAQVSKVKNLMEWAEGYDEGYDNATVQVYLGVLTTQLPPSVGGKPEIGKAHFEKAIALSDGKHLMAKVLYAKQYARLMFEQELHDELLQQVIDADPYAEGLTLINRLAQRQADRLLAESADYFE